MHYTNEIIQLVGIVGIVGTLWKIALSLGAIKVSIGHITTLLEDHEQRIRDLERPNDQ